MGMIPIDRMWERVEVSRQDADTSLFLTLMYFGEMVVKLVGVGLLAGVEDDRERHRYRNAHRLVRADGIGEWAQVVDDILSGPASQYMIEEARQEQRELTSKHPAGDWQHEAVSLLDECLRIVEPSCDRLPSKLDSRRWLSLFSALRNKTRGHGAIHSETCGKISPPLERSIRIFADNFALFKRPWAYIFRNLSGRYRVTKLTEPSLEFDVLKTRAAGVSLQDGVYVYFDQPRRVALMTSNVEATDFLFPNGSFNDKNYEIISYITNNKNDVDAAPYLAPATSLPPSETQGIGLLEVQGKSFGNLPPIQTGYIRRLSLESELYEALSDDRHPIVTLIGRGGVGKTWLALKVLHQIAGEGKFTAILWFSARDIDLLQQGPKLVTPHVLTANEIANEFVRLTDPPVGGSQHFNAAEHLSTQLTNSEVGALLFVFDNFETVRGPSELYSWLDTYIRSPNKALITSRIRDFKGDYPIEVGGMTESESEELVESTAKVLGVWNLLTEDYKRELFQESGGHPYVMKILLGEVAKARALVKVERIVATLDNILDALFERTYSGLSPAAKRVFLTLCAWRSAVPLLALEAVLLRPVNERIDVERAAEELSKSSFVELSVSPEGSELFLTVPLAAAVFGKRKLATSPMNVAIQSDLQLLHAFGAAKQSDIKHGVPPRIDRLFRTTAERITEGKDTFDNNLPMLEFIARKYPPAWLLIARLYQELDQASDLEKAKEAVRRYIESGVGRPSEKERAWDRLAAICHASGDFVGEVHALVEMCELGDIPFPRISNAVSRVNQLFSEQYSILESEERRIVSGRLAQVMEKRIMEGDATDCSRLAWLFMRLRDVGKAEQMAKVGLAMDPESAYCQNILDRISSSNLG